jgi:hypothetical protein
MTTKSPNLAEPGPNAREAEFLTALSIRKMSQEDAAHAYACLIANDFSLVNWPRVNDAIRERWPKGLVRVKTKAWKIIEGIQGGVGKHYGHTGEVK